ncbi:DUF3137 domain-containing protein [Acholeplasma vituli]|uniref:DUF3137 domain-containing protein n=1 Tax=Paracholeplasma vituli TaxID=69473 RepID=A0ABT2PY44_9MOLU|nr:DUF3137 domain-containing protein [Paracholeplasma vituli]MCU0104573.1 DUF3137 domain-containing protein [Paracholeplasma vituli]
MEYKDILASYEQQRLEMYNEYKSNLKKGFLFLIILVGFYFFAKAAQIASSYRKITKEKIIKSLIQAQYEDGYYNPKDSISLAHINSLNFYQKPDRFHGEDLMKGTYKGVKFACSDIHMEERVEHRDSKGNVTYSYQTIFKGRWYTFDYERDFDQILQVKEGRFVGAAARGLKKYETESVQFNKKFKVFASDQQYVYYQLTPVLIEKILEMESIHRGHFQMMYYGNHLDVAIYDSSDSFELKLKTPLTTDNIGHILNDIDMPAIIINEFKMDSDKFKKQ